MMSDLSASAKQNSNQNKNTKADNAFKQAFVKAGDDKQQIVHSVGSSGAKERAEVRGRQEQTPITEYTRKVELEPEVESWLEKLEKEEMKLQQPVVDDQGQVVLDDVDDKKTKFKVVLPMTKDEVERGLHYKVLNSVRWLAEWCIRMIKMFGNKVAYRKK